MKSYTLNFNGREVGAIGIFSDFTVTVCADSIDKAWLKLYDTHEHIRRGCWSVKPTHKQIWHTKSLLRCL